jgi:hypothetical protein
MPGPSVVAIDIAEMPKSFFHIAITLLISAETLRTGADKTVEIVADRTSNYCRSRIRAATG